jgi:Ca2+-binding RTX toxin-like protein
MRRAALLAALAIAAVAPATAAASTARTNVVVTQGKGCTVLPESCVTVTLIVEAAPGEANDVQLSPAGSSIVVRDAGAPLTARSGCTQEDPNTVRCSPPEGPSTGIVLVRGELGDEDDRLQNATDVATDVQGGSGADHLIGGSRSDSFGGGAGRDRLEGAAGFDLLLDGRGGKGREPDVMDGGPGTDTVRYTTRKQRVFVNLNGAGSGAQGEDDMLLGIEAVFGGAGPDIMRAGPDPVLFSGRGGNDRLAGSFGRDELYGDAGDDKLDGSFGNDRVEGGTGNDRLRGGCDRDKVYGGDGRDRIFDADGSRDLLRGGPLADFAEHAELDELARIESRRRLRIDGCAL